MNRFKWNQIGLTGQVIPADEGALCSSQTIHKDDGGSFSGGGFWPAASFLRRCSRRLGASKMYKIIDRGNTPYNKNVIMPATAERSVNDINKTVKSQPMATITMTGSMVQVSLKKEWRRSKQG